MYRYSTVTVQYSRVKERKYYSYLPARYIHVLVLVLVLVPVLAVAHPGYYYC